MAHRRPWPGPEPEAVLTIESSSSSEEGDGGGTSGGGPAADGWWTDGSPPAASLGCTLAAAPAPRTLTAIDPGTKNFSLYRYDVARDAMMAWTWMDLNGLRRTKLTSKQAIERVEALIADHPSFFDSDVVVVERQMTINVQRFRMQVFLEQRFAGRCRVVDPKATKAALLELLGPADARAITGRAVGDTQMTYAQKKRFGVLVGRALMNASERRMFAVMRRDREAWRDQVVRYDRNLIALGRTKATKPRTVKLRPDDAFETLNLALVEASLATGRNLIQRRIHWRTNKRVK